MVLPEFLLFAQTHRGYTFEQTLDLFLAEVGARVGVKPWQLQQAANAARIYRYQYRRASKDEGSGGKKLPLPDEAAMLGRLREVIRLRHYAKSTEKTYLHWTRRFLAYRRRASGKGEPTSDDHCAVTSLAFACLLLPGRRLLTCREIGVKYHSRDGWSAVACLSDLRKT